MKMSAADIKAYPKFAKYVKKELPKVINSAVIVKAMETIGQLNKAQLINALSSTHRPTVKVTPLVGAYGQFSPDKGSHEIRISKSLVEDYEAGKVGKMAPDGVTPLIGVTLLHELVHWGDDQDGVDRPGEEGEEFEIAVFGAVIG